ncbi:MAG: hypothetical protein ACK5MG_05865 [Bacteroidales bacterium]
MPTIWMIFLLFPFSVCCSQNDSRNDGAEANLENSISPFPNLVADSLMLTKAMSEIESTPIAENAFKKWISTPASQAMSTMPFAVKEVDNSVQVKTKNNARAIYALSVSWLSMDKETQKAKLYLNIISSLILEWARVNIPTKHTPLESILMPIYEAYSIVRSNIDDKDRACIDSWIELRADYYKKLELTGNLLVNNWNTVRLNLLFYYAQILDDEMLYNYSISKLKSHIEGNIFENGISHDFVNRDAFTYHGYNMLFYARILKTIALYKGKDVALQMYNYKNSKGGSVKKSVEYWKPYLIDSDNNIHLEFVNTEWEPDKDRTDYNKPYNPSGALYILDELRYIEPECSSFVQSISGAGEYGRNFKLWINGIY